MELLILIVFSQHVRKISSHSLNSFCFWRLEIRYNWSFFDLKRAGIQLFICWGSRPIFCQNTFELWLFPPHQSNLSVSIQCWLVCFVTLEVN